jgi:hypothetical protein
MSRPRFFADHDLNEHILDGVARREPAIEFIRSRDVHLDKADDAAILDYSWANRLLGVSHDVNTMTAAAHVRLASARPLAGLFMVQQSHPIGPIIDSLVLIWSASEAEEWDGQVCFLPL